MVCTKEYQISLLGFFALASSIAFDLGIYVIHFKDQDTNSCTLIRVTYCTGKCSLCASSCC